MELLVGLGVHMQILFISPYVPNPIRVRPYSFIRFLANLGHDVTLVTIWSEENEQKDLQHIRQFCKQVYAFHLPTWRSLLNSIGGIPYFNTPLQAVYCQSSAVTQQIKNLLDHPTVNFDAVHVEHLRGSRYGLLAKEIIQRNQLKIPVIWDSVDNISYLFEQAARKSRRRINRLITLFELNRTRKYERWLTSKFKQILVTSKNDRMAFLRLLDGSQKQIVEERVHVLPNGVDLDYFHPLTDQIKESHSIVISGKMSYHANITMSLFTIQQIMPLVWKELPDAKLYVVGKNPPEEIIRFGADPRIIVTGFVEDLRPFLCRASVSLAPLEYGAGIQNKVLEAMACGTAVICSSQAVSALSVDKDVDLIVEDKPYMIAQKIVELLNDNSLAQKIGMQGRQYVEKFHNWNQITADLVNIYQQARTNS